MPTKKTTADESAEKPKRRTRKKTADEPAFEETSEVESPAVFDEAEAPKKRAPRKKKAAMDIVSKKEEEEVEPLPEEEVEARIEDMRDIKPRLTSDAAFLVPEQYSFGLKDQKAVKTKKKHSGWARTLTYLLGILIILMGVTLIILTKYSNSLLEDNNTDTQVTEEQNKQSDTAKFSVIASDTEIKNRVASVVGDKVKEGLSVDTSLVETLPVTDSDMIYFKTAAQSKAMEIQTVLSDFGIKAQVTEKNDLQGDISLYMTDILKSPDLSGQVAAVYNATGVSGLAKKNCEVLQSFKVTSCQALNATNTQTGTTINYKQDKVYFTLKRTTQFKTATYSKADLNQVEDIRLTLGK